MIEKIGTDGWRELQKNSDISIEEAAAAIRSKEARGEPLKDPEPEEEKKKDDRPVLTLEYLNQYLYDNGISVRYNVISKEVEVSGMPEVFNPESLTSELHIILHDQLKSTFKCTKDLVADLLGVISGQNRYNPVLNLFATADWDGTDRFTEFLDILHIKKNDMLSKVLLFKWLCQSMAMPRNELETAYGADGALALVGDQGIGKTTLVCVLGMRNPKLYKLGQYIDTHDKDTLRRCTSSWLVELGEVETTFRSDVERLKSFITAEVDQYRLPYGRSDQKMARRTSFIATCNSTRFLIDPTGNRRFWTVPIEKIDLDRLMEFNMFQLWKQAEASVNTNPQCFRLTASERAALEERNRGHAKPLKSQEEIEDILADAADNPSNYEWRLDTISAFKAHYSSLQRYSAEQIGKALSRMGIEGSRGTIGGKQKRCRNLPFLVR